MIGEMSMPGAEAGAAAAHRMHAVRAYGMIVKLNAEEFLRLIERQTAPLIVHSAGKFLFVRHKYLTTYKGLAFNTSSSEPLPLPGDAEVIEANAIWMPR